MSTRGCRVFRCTFDEPSSDSTSLVNSGNCSVAAWGFYSANGISKGVEGHDLSLRPTEQQRRVFVSDSAGNTISIFNYTSTQVGAILTLDAVVRTSCLIDNDEWDTTGRRLLMGTVTAPWR